MPDVNLYLDNPYSTADVNEAFAMMVALGGRAGGQVVYLGEAAGESGEIHSNPANDADLTLFAARVRILGTNPKLYWRETDQAADGKVWGLSVSGGTMFWFARNDADSAGNNFMRVTRSGTAIGAVSFESGQVAIGTASPNAAAKLQIDSTTQGLLVPRMTSTQRDAISSPPDGTIIYNTTVNGFQGRAAGSWVNL